MPKAQKSLKSASAMKVKQITDFFPLKSPVSEGLSPSATRLSMEQKNTKQTSAKENATPNRYETRSKTNSGNETSLNGSNSSISSITGAVPPVPSKVIHVTSPMQPSTKRLRSQSITASRPTKPVKRTKNILCESQLEEDRMEIDENSVVYVPAIEAVISPMSNSPSFLNVPAPSNRLTSGPHFSGSLGFRSEVSLVPSSVSDEVELDSRHFECKSSGTVKETVDHWRQQALPPSPLTNASSPAELRTQPQSGAQSSTTLESDWDMDNDSAPIVTPSRPALNTITSTSFPTPLSANRHNHILPMSPVEILDSKAKTEKLIQDIKTRARACAENQAQLISSPLSDVSSLDSSDDDDGDSDGLAILGLKDTIKLSPTKTKSPVKSMRYNLWGPAPAKVDIRRFPSPSLETSPSPLARRKPAVNPLDVLLKEKHSAERKDMTSIDREARIRALAALNLDDELDGDNEPKSLSANGRTSGVDSGNPFINDEQKRQVTNIFMGDKAIKDEEEHLHRRRAVGVALWSITDACALDTYDHAIPSFDYQGSDSTLRMFAETVSYGNQELLHLIIHSGALEFANYSGSQTVIDYLINLALSNREDGLDLSALRVLPHVLCNKSITTPIALSEHVVSVLCTLGAEISVLEKVGWTVGVKSPRHITDNVRSTITERLVLCIADVAKSGRLHRREIPNLVATLLLIGMEPSASHEIRMQVSATIHEVCLVIGEADRVEVDVECAISNVILRLVQPYSVQNKLYALRFVSDAAGRTARIARFVAHAMLTDKSTLPPPQYSALPPLEELLTILITSTSDPLCPRGKFEIHDETDYVDMTCWTSILAVAITGMARYAELEESTKMSSVSKTPLKDRDESILEIIQRQLWKIHNRIQDTRAAHLDRSQTKAILAHTAFRILYQYQSIAQCRKTKTASLQSYFRRKSLR